MLSKLNNINYCKAFLLGATNGSELNHSSVSFFQNSLHQLGLHPLRKNKIIYVKYCSNEFKHLYSCFVYNAYFAMHAFVETLITLQLLKVKFDFSLALLCVPI